MSEHGINPHAIRVVRAALYATTEARISRGEYLPDDSPLVPMSLFLTRVLSGLHALNFKELVLLERHNVQAATGSPRCFCYVAAQAPNGVKLCWCMNLTEMDDRSPVNIAQYVAERALPWDGVTPVEYAVHQMEGPDDA